MSHFAQIVRIVKTVTMGWAGHVVRVEVRNVYSANIVTKNLKETDHFRYMSMIILKQILMK
jgi:translation elongation factor P/translation initiation factor 5A